MRRAHLALILMPLVSNACDEATYYPPGGSQLPPPTNLTYEVTPSGTPGAPSGILLSWDATNAPELAVWHIYSRGTTSGEYGLRSSTTSNTFHDAGYPDLQYYVTAEDLNGYQSGPSNVVTVDERLALVRPAALSSTSLNGAVALAWSDDSYLANPTRFRSYQVYSTAYDLDRDLCDGYWVLEGTTVAPEFVAGALTNGVPRCFAVSAVSVEGWESLWSPLRADTPRPEARFVVIYARQVQDAGSGFRFWRDVNGNGHADPGELGLVQSGSATSNDFTVERAPDGRLYLTPVRAGTTVTAYGTSPIPDLTSIDWAPVGGYSATPIEAQPGWGYVFETDGGDGFARYGGVRLGHVGRDFIILDWSFQTDHGNPELLRAAD